MVKLKKIILILISFIITNYIYADLLILKDFQILNGELASIDKNRIVYYSQKKYYIVLIKDINVLYPENLSNLHNMLTLVFNSEYKIKVNMVKLTESKLYYKSFQSEELSSVFIHDLKNIEILHKDTEVFFPKQQIYISTNMLFNINQIFQEFINLKFKENNLDLIKEDYFSFINEKDFYKKFWESYNSLFNFDSKNYIWEILELYSDQEHKIELINDKRKNNANISSQLYDIRIQFLKRVCNILISYELINLLSVKI